MTTGVVRRVSANRGRRRLRWMIGAGSSALVIAGALSLAVGSSAEAAVSPGTGSSYAQALQDQPHDGSLAVGVVLGEALAGHTNGSARAQSQGVDLGAIGTSLTSFNCGSAPTLTPAQIPEPLETETGEAGAAAGITQTATTTGLVGNPPPSFGSTEFVQANGTPYGEADTTFGPVNAGAFNVSGMTTKAWSGIVNGVREAGATSDISALNLVDGVVQISGLHWQVLYPSGGSTPPSGSFSIGKLVVDGTQVAAPDLSSVTSFANTLLASLGITIVPPAVSLQSGIESVSPLQIEVVPNTNRDEVLNDVLNGVSPLLNPLLTGLENGFTPSEPSSLVSTLCQSDTPITVADVAIASVNGGGYYTTALGGVNATSGATPTNPFNLSLPSLLGVSTTKFVPGTEAVAGTPATPGTPGTPAVAATPGSSQPIDSSPPTDPSSGGSTVPTASTDTTTPAAAAPTVTAAAVGHAPGGPLLAIGLGGLALVALLAEGDRRMMRRAQHTVNFDHFEE